MKLIFLLPLFALLLNGCVTEKQAVFADRPQINLPSSPTAYWDGLEALCREFAGAAEAKCGRAKGADVIVGEIARICATNFDCLDKAAQLCAQFSPSTRPPCNTNGGLEVVLTEVRRSAKFYKLPAQQYWDDIVGLCSQVSTAGKSNCNRTSGSRTVLSEVNRACQKDPKCLQRSVELCEKYSPATRPPCAASFGLGKVLGELDRAAKFY